MGEGQDGGGGSNGVGTPGRGWGSRQGMVFQSEVMFWSWGGVPDR